MVYHRLETLLSSALLPPHFSANQAFIHVSSFDSRTNADRGHFPQSFPYQILLHLPQIVLFEHQC